MAHFVVVIYFVSIVVGCSALLLFWIIYIKSKIQIIKQYVIFMLLYTMYLIIKLFDSYMLTVVRYSNPDVYVFSSLLYFVWFMFFIYETPYFFHSLVELPVGRVQKNIFRGTFLFVLILLVIPFVIESNSQNILRIMKFELHVICGSMFIMLLLYVIYIVWDNENKVKGKINKKILKTIFILCTIFFPGFIIDTFSQKLQVEWKIIPYGLEFSIIFYLTWNIISIIYVVQYFLSRTAIVRAPTITQEFIKKYSISEREREIIELIIKGYSNKQIAETLFISLQTIKNHVYNIFRKVGVESRTKLIEKINNFG